MNASCGTSTFPTRRRRALPFVVRTVQPIMEEIDKEQLLLKMRRDNLKNQMFEEQKMAHFNRMKILTHWRKIMRVAKTEQLKKEIQIYQ